MGGVVRLLQEMRKAAGVRKPSESQKAKALWKMKAARESGEDFYDTERKDNILGRNKTRLELWERHLKDPIVALDKALKCVENQYRGWLLDRDLSWNWSSMACGREGSGMVPKMWDKPLWEGVWPYLDPWDTVRLRTASTHWTACSKEVDTALHLSRKGESMCLDRSAHDGWGKCPSVGQWLWLKKKCGGMKPCVEQHRVGRKWGCFVFGALLAQRR